MKTKKKNIIICGANGYIGTNLNYFFLKRKIYPVLFDKKTTNNKKIIKINLLNFAKILKFTKNKKIDFIIHLAAHSSLSSFKKNPKRKINENIKMTENIIKLSKIKNAKIIFASSASIYGNLKSKAEENMKPNPISNYGKSKILCEKKLKLINDHKILRLFNVVGNLNNIMHDKSFFDILEKKKKVNLNYNYKLKKYLSRDFIHIYDLCNIILSIIKNYNSIKFQTINIGTGKSVNCKKILNLFYKFYKINYDKKINAANNREITYSCSNNKILKSFYKLKYNNINFIIKNLRLK